MKPYHKNPRQITSKQLSQLRDTLRELGDLSGIVHDVNSDEIIGGNQRGRVFDVNKCEVVLEHSFDEPDEQGTIALGYVVWEGKRYGYRAVSWTAEQCEKANIVANKAGGSWDFDVLANEFDVDDLLSWGFEAFELSIDADDVGGDMGVEPNAQPNPRVLPLDVIYTLQGADVTCCLAALAGLKYGIQSGSYRLCPYTSELSGRHEVAFVDNDYFAYDHAKHVETVARFRPKYATVRDVMTEAQCAAAGIDYYPLEQILDWADELSQHAQNVIVIPKFDCIDAIPERYMLGYSVPTSHGGTPLHVDLFRGRRVHLLGGSWKAQLAHLAALGDDVVSLDNNYLQKQANFAGFVYPDGSAGSLEEDLGIKGNNPRYTALSISFGNVAAKVNELYRTDDDSQTR